MENKVIAEIFFLLCAFAAFFSFIFSKQVDRWTAQSTNWWMRLWGFEGEYRTTETSERILRSYSLLIILFFLVVTLVIFFNT